jgi:hypothetical protein
MKAPGLNYHSALLPDTSGAIFPYFTQPDPELNRDSSGRDPLGLLPVWSEIGRGLVPNLASPVLQANGIRAVLLIHWIGELLQFRKLLTTARRTRGFMRLMEGVIEYWLNASGRKFCFGSQALAAAGDAFSVTASSGKTVANGLHQYYRGSCQRAGLFDADWIVEDTLGKLFEQAWNNAATAALVDALGPCLEKGKLAVAPLLKSNPRLGKAFADVFGDKGIGAHLACMLGEDRHRALAQNFAELRSLELKLHECAARLASDELSVEIDRMHRCEPFLLILQDTFDILRASPNMQVPKIAESIEHCVKLMQERAVAFAGLQGQVRSPRMKPMVHLASLLIDLAQPTARGTLAAFIVALVEYHRVCMKERGRDPMVILEGELVVVPGDAQPDAKFARQRLLTAQPWDNDYYLNAAATIHSQLQRGQA